MTDETHPTDDSIDTHPLDRDLYEPSPSAGFRTVYRVMEVAL